MNWLLTFALFLVIIICALTALSIKDLLAAVFMLAAYSFACALLFAQLGAVDVAFTEAVVGAGVSGVFLIAALYYVKRRSKD